MKKKMVTALLAVSMLAGLSAVNVMAADRRHNYSWFLTGRSRI